MSWSDIPSGPTALCVLKFLNVFNTSSSVINISLMIFLSGSCVNVMGSALTGIYIYIQTRSFSQAAIQEYIISHIIMESVRGH